MTPTTQPAAEERTPLTDNGHELVAAAQSIVYDPKGVEMIQQALENTRRSEAIAPTVGMIAVTLLSQMGPKLNDLDEEEMWGKNGVVHVVLDSIFEVAKQLGFKAPLSDLKQAYQLVEEQLGQEEAEGGADDEASEMDEFSGPQPGGMAQPQMPMMGGVMPEGMQ